MSNTHKFCTWTEQFLEGFEIELTLIVNRNTFQYSSLTLTHHLPGNYVGMMLRLPYQNFISALKHCFTKGKSKKIDRVSRA